MVPDVPPIGPCRARGSRASRTDFRGHEQGPAALTVRRARAHPLDVESIEHPDDLFAGAAGKLEAEGLVVDAHVLHGNYVAGVIADYARARPVSSIAAASNNRRGVVRFALGSTTMGLVGLAPCPVLVTHT